MSLLSPCKRKWTPSPLAGEGWGEVQSSKLESPQPLRCSGDASLPTPTANICLLRTSVAGMTARRREIPDNPAGSANRLPFWNDGMRTNQLPFWKGHMSMPSSEPERSQVSLQTTQSQYQSLYQYGSITHPIRIDSVMIAQCKAGRHGYPAPESTS